MLKYSVDELYAGLLTLAVSQAYEDFEAEVSDLLCRDLLLR